MFGVLPFIQEMGANTNVDVYRFVSIYAGQPVHVPTDMEMDLHIHLHVLMSAYIHKYPMQRGPAILTQLPVRRGKE